MDKRASQLAIGTTYDPALSADSRGARQRLEVIRGILESASFRNGRPVLLSVNPWQPRVEHLRLFAHLRNLVQCGGNARILLRRHLIGARESYLGSYSATHGALMTILDMFNIRSGIEIRNWDNDLVGSLLDKRFQAYMSRIDPQVSQLRARDDRHRPGLAEYWTTAADCFFAAEQAAPYILSDAERLPYREACFRAWSGMGYGRPPVLLGLCDMPKIETPLLFSDDDSDWRESITRLSARELRQVETALIAPVQAALKDGKSRGPKRSTRKALPLQAQDVIQAIEAIHSISVQCAATRERGFEPMKLVTPQETDRAFDALRRPGARRVLRAIMASGDGLTQAEIRSELGAEVDKVTTYSWLNALEAAGLISKGPGRPARYTADPVIEIWVEGRANISRGRVRTSGP